jgi:hypothetical protein
MPPSLNRHSDEYRTPIRTVMLVTLAVAVLFALSILYRQILASQTSAHSHIRENSVSPTPYTSIPPTSGAHYNSTADWAVHAEPLRYEQVLHNLEEGGVAIYYQCEQACPELVAQLEAIVTPYLESGRKVLLLPNVPTWGPMYNEPWHQDMEARIAVTAWQHLEKYNEVEPAQIHAFIKRYEGIDHHPPEE